MVYIVGRQAFRLLYVPVDPMNQRLFTFMAVGTEPADEPGRRRLRWRVLTDLKRRDLLRREEVEN